MKSFTIVCLGLLAVALPHASSKYTDKYDSLNIDEILANRRLLLSYVKCMLDQGKCSPEGKKIKFRIADALDTDCSKCTEKQKTETRKVLKHLINNEPEFWTQLSNKYDPDSNYAQRYKEELQRILQ